MIMQRFSKSCTPLVQSPVHSRFTKLSFVLSFIILLAGCGAAETDDEEGADDQVSIDSTGSDTSSDCGNHDYTTTFAAIQGEIFEAYGCTNSACHGTSPGSGDLDLTTENVYEQLVDATSSSSTMKRVSPGHHETSFLYNKLAAKTLGETTTGTAMPSGGFSALTEDHLEALHLWIDAGANEELVIAGTAELLATCLPQASTLKIDVPDAPEAGFGVQMQSTAWSLPHESEDEICLATYYDFTETNLIPTESQVDCPDFAAANNPSGKCFRVHKKI